MKFISRIIPMMAVALGVLAFAACGDDDPTTPPPGDDLKPMAAYSVQATADLLEVADVVVTYYDANGNAQTETITTTDVWQKKVSVTAGKNVGCSVRVTPVAQNAGGDNAPIAKSGATYDLGLSFGHVFYEVDENGAIKKQQGNGFSADGSVIMDTKSHTVAADKVKALLDSGVFNDSCSAVYVPGGQGFNDSAVSENPSDSTLVPGDSTLVPDVDVPNDSTLMPGDEEAPNDTTYLPSDTTFIPGGEIPDGGVVVPDEDDGYQEPVDTTTWLPGDSTRVIRRR